MLNKMYLIGNHALTTELPCKVTPARVLRLVSESPSMTDDHGNVSKVVSDGPPLRFSGLRPYQQSYTLDSYLGHKRNSALIFSYCDSIMSLAVCEYESS